MTAIDVESATSVAAGDSLSVFRAVTVSRAKTVSRDTVAPRTQPALERRQHWERRYMRRLALTDTAVVVAIAALVSALNAAIDGTALTLGAAVTVVVTVVVWSLSLRLGHTRAMSIVGSGATEYKRVVHATGFAFGILAILFILFEWQGVRILVAIALPLGLLALLLDRWLWRKWLLAQRRFGHFASRAIVTGSVEDIEYVIRTLDDGGALGYVVIGAAPSDAGAQGAIVVNGHSYPVIGPMDTVPVHARELGADSIIVASRPNDEPDYVKRLSWELEGTAAELILSSRLTDVAGPRISLRQVEGLPLIHVKIPQFEGGTHSLKRAMDVALASVALIPVALLAPFIALAIKLDSKGPVFFQQTRIGRDGREFGMIKFRTMHVDAEARLAELQAHNEGAGVLFKMKNDPRVTRVGAILRKFSLDELPQFVNVLKGDMSVVGPRPPLPREVTAYDGTVFRRLYIKPGITGLWQVSGRSDLSWEESVRLDLRYVENWSITGDLMIMWRTARVMVRPKGAY